MDMLVEMPEPGCDRLDEARPDVPIWAEPRHLFFFRLATLTGEGDERSIETLALAESGVIIRTAQPLSEGSRWVIELNSHYCFAVRVEWSCDALAGLEFEDREHVRATLEGRDRGHPYRAPRLELDADVALRLGEACFTARARDVSEGGIKVELDEPAPVGCETSVIVPGMLPVAGRIQWCHDGRAGISFERPLPFRNLIDCLTRQPSA